MHHGHILIKLLWQWIETIIVTGINILRYYYSGCQNPPTNPF